jgi:microcystin-dependent protein
MSSPYIGEVRLVGFNFAPLDWSFCNGQLLSISENSTLFTLIGTTYGGDGQSTFGLPDLRGRVPVHQGSLPGGGTYVIGQVSGVENVTINFNSYPNHSHALSASSNPGTSSSPNGNVAGTLANSYSAATPTASLAMNAQVLAAAAGSNQPHENLQPYVVLNWVIALYGVYPSQS